MYFDVETTRLTGDFIDFLYSAKMLEFSIDRKSFGVSSKERTLRVEPYEKNNLLKYLRLLDGNMEFRWEIPSYVSSMDTYEKAFARCKEQCSFEAFWIEDELAGLYWREGMEIKMIAVAAKYQHRGYGTEIITRALEKIFNTDKYDKACLYTMDSNLKAVNFYIKYGFNLNGTVPLNL